MTIERFKLDQIAPNPFQTRQAEDPAEVARLAESIAQVGLLQIPVGRMDPDRRELLGVQLAFGHTRLAAFKALAAEGVEGHADRLVFEEMPVDIRELTDIEMFELTVRENLDRKDLTPIEEARAMATYRDKFGKTSAEIGVLFGLSDSAVRNKMRLLDLPAPVQEKVQSREINEGTARRLMVLQKMAPQAIPHVTEVLTGKEALWRADSVDEEIQAVLEEESHRLPAGRDESWPLEWKGTVEPPAPAEVAKLLGKGAPKVAELVGIMEAFRSGTDVDGAVKLYGIREDHAERIRQLVAPPACSVCDFHQVFQGDHFCGMKACAERKEQAWRVHELDRMSRKLGIPVYEPGRDGTAKIEPPEYYSAKAYGYALDPRWQKLLDAKDENLRVIAADEGSVYRNSHGTGSPHVRLILVGEGAKKALAKKQAGASVTPDSDWQRKERERRQKAENSKRFLEKTAAPIFASMIKPLDNLAVLEALFHVVFPWGRPALPTKKAERISRLRELIARQLLEDDVAGPSVQSRGPVATAKQLVGLAKSLGVRLPADWLKRAEGYALATPSGMRSAKGKINGKSVSTETDEED